jgi:ParB family chromosome partitioning protein
MTMTEHITVTHLTDQPQPETSTAPAATGVDLVHVPAADVVIENNVRTAADLDAAFLASVKQHGVLLPTIGYRNADGAVVVRDGQMRVLAARETAATCPCSSRPVTTTRRSGSRNSWSPTSAAPP